MEGNNYNVSGCVFIRNTFDGAFCIFESMASILPFVDELFVLDLGSDDGTLESLREIEASNKKVKILTGKFPYTDANVFATLANELIAQCNNDNILYFQSDEIWHEDLLRRMEDEFKRGKFDWSFWRIQFRENFQIVKWFPYPVHRVGPKNNFNFVGDGMNSDRQGEAPLCSKYDGGWFLKWGKMDPMELPVNEMITDISMVGAFLENIPKRRLLHAPFWHEEPHIEGKPSSEWMTTERGNANWTKNISPFNLPKILKGLVGTTKYSLRWDILKALKEDSTRDLLGI